MSSTTAEYHYCAVCENKTTTRCSRCKETCFCSRDCQALVWHTHRVVCGGDSTAFCLPPLTDEELACVQTAHNLVTHKPNGTLKLLEFLSQYGLYNGCWDDLIDLLHAKPSSHPEWQRSGIIAASQFHFRLVLEPIRPTTSTPPQITTWSRIAGIVFLAFVPDDLPAHTIFQRLVPFYRQILPYYTCIQAKEDNAERSHHRALSDESLRVVFERCHRTMEAANVSETTKATLREYCMFPGWR